MKKFVAVAGNIGVGKSTLVGMLCNRMGWEPFFEAVDAELKANSIFTCGGSRQVNAPLFIFFFLLFLGALLK